MATVYDPLTWWQKEQTAPASVSFWTNDISSLSKTTWVTSAESVSTVSTPTTPTTTWYTQAQVWGGIAQKGTAWDSGLSSTWNTGVIPKDQAINTTADDLITGGEVTTGQKLQYEQEGLQQDQLNKDLLWAAKVVEEGQYQKDYQTSQEQNRLEREWLQVQNAEIASSQRIRDAGQQLDNLKQNIAYIGNMWRPAKSAVQMEALKTQLSTADQTFRELVQVEDNLKTIQKLWVEYNAAAFENQMKSLQDQLDTQVGTALQGIITDFNKEADGVDTMDELNALREKRLESTDTTLEWITNRNLMERQNRIEQFQAIIEDKKAYITNSNTVNKEMSAVQWYYVNGNGEAIISATTWQPIALPEEAPMDPIFDKDSGKLISFTTDENWQIQAKVDQVIDQPQFSSNVMTSMIQAINNGTMTVAQALQILPKEAQPAFLAQVGGIQQQATQYAPKWWSKLDDWSLYNQDTWEIRSVDWTTSNTTVQTNPQSIIDFSTTKRRTTNLQCGELVNDYVYKITGTDPTWAGRMWDTYQSKINAVKSIGIVTWPVEWWLFVSNPLNNNVWHTGIVQSVNPDGSFTVLEANASGKASGEQPTIKTYNSTEWMTFSQAPQWQENNNPVIDTLLWSGKFTKDQAAAMKNAINNGEDPNTVIKNQAKSILWTEWKTLTQYETTLHSMNALKDALNQFYSKWWDTGILRWNFEKVVNSLWKVDNPELKSLAVQVQSALQIYRNAISGTAYSEQEGKDIADIFPWINKSKNLNDSIFAGRNAAIQSVIDGMYSQAIGEKAYSQIKSWTDSTTTTQTQTPTNNLANPKTISGNKSNADYLKELWITQ